MTLDISVEDARGKRSIPFDRLPLVIGGPASDVDVPATNAPVAYVGAAEGEIFVQPADGCLDLLCNGTPLRTSQWLRDGDVLGAADSRILVRSNEETLSFAVTTSPTTGTAESAAPPPVLVPPSAPASRATSVRPVAFEPRPLTSGRRSRRLPGVASLVTGAALVVLALVAWFLFGARSIAVQIEPEPDSLTLRGSLPAFEIAGRYLLRPGLYALTAEKEGYAPLEVPIEVGEDSDTQFRFTLERLPGSLVVQTTEGARIEVDDAEMGTAPLPAFTLSPGLHEIRVQAEGFLDYEGTVTIEGGGMEQTFVADLVSRRGTVVVSSEPIGATVSVDGRTMGQTPVTIGVGDGRHEIVLRLAGFAPHRQTIQLAAEEELQLPSVRLVPADGVLALSSEPAGAAVTLDGSYRGETPLELEVAPGRRHRVSLSRAGYQPASRELTLAAGARRELSIPLEPRLGTVELTVEPADAEVLIDGASQGRGTRTLELDAVEHRIEVRREGYETHSTSVTPRPGFPLAVDVRLRSTQEAAKLQQASNPPQRNTSQRQVMVLVRPGRFQMGASRREAGRRANETLREVELSRPFYLSAREITNREFRVFRPEHHSGTAGGVSLDGDDYPVVEVSWEDAARYCNWLSAQEGLPPVYHEQDGKLVATAPFTDGYRLPTEAEWAWAARFHGNSPRKYPWGDSLPVPPNAGDYADSSARDLLSGVLTDYHDGFAATAPVSTFGPDERGFYGFGGNVAEWMHDFYTIYPAGAAEPQEDPVGPATGEFHVIRGSSWMHSTITELRLTFRDYGNAPRADVGFRIARSAGPATPSPTRTTP